MPTEDRLPGALERAAGPLPETVGDWDALRAAGSARWRRRRSEAGVAIATVVALTLGIVFAADDTEDGHSVVTMPPVNQEILARIVESGVQKLVIASAADGSVVRGIAADAALANWGSAVSVPDAGSVAYVTIGEPDPNSGSCGSDIQTSPIVARVDLSTGSLTPLVRASNAAIVSPDGRRVAYVAGLGGCTVLPEDRDETLGFLEVASGEVTRPYDDRDPRVLAPIAWSRDGARLLTMGPSGDNRTTSFLELDEFPVDASPTPIALPELFRDATYLPDGRLVVAYVAGFDSNRPSDAVSKVAIVNKRGAVTEPLFETKANFNIESIDVGRDGRLVLTSGFGGLAVWTPGEDAPIILIEGGGPLEVRGAAWLPSKPQP